LYHNAFLLLDTILTTVAEHLVGERLGVVDTNVAYLTLIVVNRHKTGVDETLVWSQVKPLVSLKHFGMEAGINFYGIAFYQLAGRFVVTLTLDALNFSQ
jgi:hypothetical protein